MKDYLIEQALTGRNAKEDGENGRPRTAELRLCDGGEKLYLSVSVEAHCTLFFLSDCSALALLENDDGDPDTADWFERHLLCEIGDFAAYFRTPDEEWHAAFLVLLYLACSLRTESETFLADAAGKHLSEVIVPAFSLPQFITRQ